MLFDYLFIYFYKSDLFITVFFSSSIKLSVSHFKAEAEDLKTRSDFDLKCCPSNNPVDF